MIKCRICSAAEADQRIRAEYVYGGKEEHKFWQCNKCNAIYLFPVPTVAEEEQFYRREFEKFMSDRSGSERDWSNAEAHVKTNQDQIKRRWPFLAPYLRSGAKVLEIGCSSGFMLNAFRDYGLDCTGVEPSGTFAEFVKKNGHRVYDSVDALPSESQFDLVVSFFLLEHIRDPFLFFKKTYALLSAGGTFIAEVPCAMDPLTSLYHIPAFERFYWSIAHHYYYTPKSLSYVLNAEGFSYELIPEQRYDLSNHITWMIEGKSGGQGKFNHVFSEELVHRYKEDLKRQWLCDTMFLVVPKK